MAPPREPRARRPSGRRPTRTASGRRRRCAARPGSRSTTAASPRSTTRTSGHRRVRDLQLVVSDGRTLHRARAGLDAPARATARLAQPLLPPGQHRPGRALPDRQDLHHRPGAQQRARATSRFQCAHPAHAAASTSCTTRRCRTTATTTRAPSQAGGLVAWDAPAASALADRCRGFRRTSSGFLGTQRRLDRPQRRPAHELAYDDRPRRQRRADRAHAA